MTTVQETWEERKKNLPEAAKAEAEKWKDKKHQLAEWGKFKKHRVFYLEGTIGISPKKKVPLVQFSQK